MGGVALKKTYFLVDRDTGKIICEKRLGVSWQKYYEACPEMRKRIRVQYAGVCCMDIAITLFAAGCFFQSLISYALLFTVLTIALECATWFMEKTINEKKKTYSSIQHNNYDNDPTKKIVFVVDSETNAIVDVKRLGKWGQRYVEWRGRRQKGGA